MTLIDEAIAEIEEIEQRSQDSRKPFNPSKWLNNQIEEKGLEQVTITTYARKKSFRNICEAVKKDFAKKIEQNYNSDKQKAKPEEIVISTEDEYIELQHKAVIGEKFAVSYFISKINEYLRTHNITSNDYPSIYDTLADAIFHEVWGLSILHKWEKYPESEAAVIRGKELWIDVDGQFVKQSEEFESEEAVDRIKRAFTMRSKDAVINTQSPELEIEKEDGSRITMMQKPRSRENYIMFRRFVVKDISLYEQARRKTIPEEDIDIFRAISRTMCNVVFAGRVRSAKSTFLKSMMRERDPKYVAAIMEKHFELHISEQMPDRLCFEVQAKEGDLHQVVPRLLRMEHDYIVVGEIRSLETEAYLQATERGERGAFTTYHLTDPHGAVPQITRHILDEFPNRNFENELERVARNIDLIITLASDRDRRRKRVIGVTEIIWNEDDRQYETRDLIRYSSVTDKYYYSANLSPRLIRLMAEEDLEETKKLLRLLKEREATSPMSEYEKIGDAVLEDILKGDSNG